MSVPGPIRSAARTAQGLALMAVPHGGQQIARRNAWASMSENSVRSRARREADVAMSRAIAARKRTAAAR